MNKRKGVKPIKSDSKLINAKDLERNLRKVIEKASSKNEEYSKELDKNKS